MMMIASWLLQPMAYRPGLNCSGLLAPPTCLSEHASIHSASHVCAKRYCNYKCVALIMWQGHLKSMAPAYKSSIPVLLAVYSVKSRAAYTLCLPVTYIPCIFT